MDNFTRIPINQAKFLLKIQNSANQMVLADGKSEGATAKQLFRLGYIKPHGMIGGRIRWLLVKSLAQDTIDYFKKL